MNIDEKGIRWLASQFPDLQYDAKSQKIVGELDFNAAYDNKSGEVVIGERGKETELFLSDVFEIEIYLENLDGNGWPKVYEVGGRQHEIAQKSKVKLIDLHFYSDDGNCCLGIKYGNNEGLRIESFLYDLVIPFFYRLSYTEEFGIAAARRDLWGEYSHGEAGPMEYQAELLNFEKQNLPRNDACPCGSGKKYKKCHLREVEFLTRILNRLCPCGSGRKYRECHSLIRNYF